MKRLELVTTVGGRKLYRGSRPETIDEVKPFHSIVSLEEGWFDWFFNQEVDIEKDWCELSKVEYYHRPLSDFRGPLPYQLEFRILLLKNLLMNGDVLVHCLHGEDRTGMVIAAWRIIEEQWPVEKAKQEMFDHGFHNVPYFFWTSALNQIKGVDK